MRTFTVIKLGEKFLRPPKPGGINDLAKSFLAPPRPGAVDTSHPRPSPVEPDADRALKATRSRQRVNTELEAAIALHKAGMPCKVRRSVVCAVKGWSRPTLYRRIAAKKFPEPTKDGRYSWWWIADVFDDP